MELTSLPGWLYNNKLILNLKKTEFVVFGTHQKLCRQNTDGIDITLEGGICEKLRCFQISWRHTGQ